MSILKNNAETFMRRLFQIEIEPENLNYDAYDIGDTLHHYTIYRGKDNTIYRAVLIVDKKLASRTVGRLLGKEIKNLNEMAMSMIKELSQNFVETAFQTDFKNYHPDISMLWNTEFGRIAFCIKSVKVPQ